MPHYYFHLTTETGRTLDPEGQDYSGLPAAIANAERSARGIMAEDVRDGSLDLTPELEVTDHDGLPLHRLPFADALKIRHH